MQSKHTTVSVMNEISTNRRTVFASLGALASVLAASSCCLPLIPFLAGRPFLLALWGLLFAYGFWRARRARQCYGRPSRWSTVLLWLSAVCVVVSIFLPQVIAELLAG